MDAEGPDPRSRAAGAYRRSEGGRGADRRVRFGLLLAALAASFFVEGIARPGDVERAVTTVLLGGTLILSFWAADLPPRRMRSGAVLVGIIVIAVLVALMAGSGKTIDGVSNLANGLLVALAPVAVVAGILRNLRANRAVTVEVALGALCLYLLAGLFFAFVYGAIDNLGGDPFFTGGLGATPPRSVYFSFATLTTVGYGDLTTHTNLGHTLSVTEALMGQIYLVTIVAVIMGNLVPGRRPRG